MLGSHALMWLLIRSWFAVKGKRCRGEGGGREGEGGDGGREEGEENEEDNMEEDKRMNYIEDDDE